MFWLDVFTFMQNELSEFKIKAEEFEKRICEAQKQAEALTKETEESQTKISQLQEMIERYKKQHVLIKK